MPTIGSAWETNSWDVNAWAAGTWVGVNKLPLVITDGVVERLQSGDVLINQRGTVVYAVAAFAADNLILRSDGAGFGSQASGLSLSDDNQLIWENSNVLIGESTGALITTAEFNVLIGGFAGASLTSGNQNFLLGESSGLLMTTGRDNVGIGAGTLTLSNGDKTVAIGFSSGNAITTGDNNVFIGELSGAISAGQLATANRSTAIGESAVTTKDDQVVLGSVAVVETILRGVVEGDDGTFVYNPSAFVTDNAIVRADTVTGTDAVQTSDLTLSDLGQLFWNQTPPNVIIGYNQTGRSFTTGQDNMLMGGFCGVEITTGIRNMLIGGSSGTKLTIGNQNCAVGFGSLALAITDPPVAGETDDNVAIGNRSGFHIIKGSQNVFIGSEAGNDLSNQKSDAVNSIAIGYLTFTTEDNQMILGNTSITDTKIRGVVELKQTTDLETSGAHLPGFKILDSAGASVFEIMAFTQSSGNMGLGSNAANSITSGSSNTCVGINAGTSLTTGTNNMYFGASAGLFNTTGIDNLAMGGGALTLGIGGNNNIAIGVAALAGLSSGSDNTGIGQSAGVLISTGTGNTFIGKHSGFIGQLATADDSIAIGKDAVTTKDDQCVLGAPVITETILRGDVEIQNGTNAQAILVYNTFTSDTAHELLAISWNESTNVATIETQKGSVSGTARALEFGTDGTTRITIGAAGGFTVVDANHFTFSTTGTGTNLGTGVTELMGFWGKTPIVQPAAANQAAITNSTGGTGDGTLAAIGDTTAVDQGPALNDNLTDLHELLDEIRTALVAAGLMKGAA